MQLLAGGVHINMSALTKGEELHLMVYKVERGLNVG